MMSTACPSAYDYEKNIAAPLAKKHTDIPLCYRQSNLWTDETTTESDLFRKNVQHYIWSKKTPNIMTYNIILAVKNCRENRFKI